MFWRPPRFFSHSIVVQLTSYVEPVEFGFVNKNRRPRFVMGAGFFGFSQKRKLSESFSLSSKLGTTN